MFSGNGGVASVFSVLAGITGIVLVAGVSTPAFTLDRLGGDPMTYSVFGGGMNLIQQGSVYLGLTILCFSVVFPIAKLLGLIAIIWIQSGPRKQFRRLRILEFLGKWSMLDVFVVATLIGAAQLGILSDVSARDGIYLFMFAIVGSIMLTVAVTHWLGHGRSVLSRGWPRRTNTFWPGCSSHS
ncbi:MAG TPA: paraquat-inducible protein A [Woeseiaceae bacterium]|nr:paraquat-inducible protein A [Woeseiaceae bacterium]